MSQNLEIAQGIYQSFSVGDIPAVLATFKPDINWTEAPGGPYGGVSIGPQAVLENVFMKLGGEWNGFAAVPEEFVTEGDTVVVLGEYSAEYKATGKSFRAPFAHVWKFEDGKVKSFVQHVDTALHLEPMKA